MAFIGTHCVKIGNLVLKIDSSIRTAKKQQFLNVHSVWEIFDWPNLI